MIEPGLELSSFWATEKLSEDTMQEHGLVPKWKSIYTVHFQDLKNPILQVLYWGTSLVGPVVKNLPFSTEDLGSIPGLGIKILCAMRELSPCSGTHAPQLERSPRVVINSPHATTKTWRSQKKKKKKEKFYVVAAYWHDAS